MAAHELGQREYHLEWSVNLALLLIELGEEEIALDHLRGDFALRESKNVALRAALLLLERGFELEAHRLFDLAEPLDLLRGEPEHYFRADAEIDTLFAWAEVAPYFRPLAAIAETVRALRDESFGFRGREDRDLASHYRAQLLAFAGVGGLYAGHADEVDALLEQFDRTDFEQATAWLRLVINRFLIERAGNATARERLDASLSEVEPGHVADWMRLRVAEELFHLGDLDGSRTWLASVDPPSAPEGGGYDEGARAFMPMLRFHRLRTALGLPIDPETIAEPRNSHYTLLTAGIRAIVRLANIWGSAVAGGGTTAEDFVSEVRQIIGVLDRRASRDDLGWYAIEAATPELLSLVVHAAAVAGTDALEPLKTLFLERWLNKNPPDDDELRRVLLAFLEHIGDEPWIGDELERYETGMLRNKDVTGQIDACFAQARAWLQLGRRDKAREFTLLGFARSSGVGYRKDYQLNTWIELMGPLLRETGREAEVEWLARALARLDESTEGRASALATEELLRQTAAAHPRTAVRILRTLPGQGVLSEWEALAAFLEGLATAPENDLAWLCLLEVLVATARSAEPSAVQALARAVEPEPLRSWLERMTDRVSVHGLPTTRLYWRRALSEIARGRGLSLEAVGLTADDLEPSDRAPRSLREEPSSSDSSPADEVRTPADLFAALELGSVDDYRLQAAVERVVDQLDREEVVRVSDAFRATDRAALIFARLARRLAALGDTATARAFAEEAIAAGRPSGWVPYIDGGTRIRPLEALAHVDASAARDRLWELLEGDAEDESFNPGGLADSFEALVVIADDGQAIPIASDVRDHVRSLLGAVAEIDDLVSADDVATVDVAAACATVLVDNLLARDAIRAEAGARACLDAATAGDESILQRLAAAARDGGEATRRALHVLAASALLSGPAEPALSALRDVAASPHSEEDRRLAEDLATELGAAEVGSSEQSAEAEASLLGLLNRPVQRPAEVTGGPPPRETKADDWLAGAAGGTETAPTHAAGGVIIGEFTSLIRLEWELPHERREQAAVPADSTEPERVPFVMNIPMRSYHLLGANDDLADELGDALVFNFTEPGDDPWSSLGAALNPLVARQVGWRPSDGLLAWEDAEGQRMCWSIWWRDGHRDHRPPSFDDLIGEGWIVVATPEAVRQIEDRLGPLERFVEVTRYASYRHETGSVRRPLDT
ncbi:MAG: hypothetical protein WD689_11230 [Gaiellaceae bacterium]